MLSSDWKIGDKISLTELEENGVHDVYESALAYYFVPIVEGNDLSIMCRMEKNDGANEATVEFITHVANTYPDVLTAKNVTDSHGLW